MNNPDFLWLGINSTGIPAIGYLFYIMDVEVRQGFMSVFMTLNNPVEVPGPWSEKNWPFIQQPTVAENFEAILSFYCTGKKKLFETSVVEL